jgi:transcriptional regulator with XRE-family HTH domain
VKIAPVPTAQPRRRQTNRKQLLGERVRAYRLELGISQEGLADRCGLHRNYISSIERGQVNVSFENLVTLAVGLGVDVGELVASIT